VKMKIDQCNLNKVEMEKYIMEKEIAKIPS
jgi:hypothetical protein